MVEKEYIERNNVISHKRPFTEFDEGGWSCKVQAVAVEDIQNIPAADVAPVRHGHWVSEYDCGYITPHCSECGETALTKEETSYDYVHSSYCPHCGAKMDGDTNGS